MSEITNLDDFARYKDLMNYLLKHSKVSDLICKDEEYIKLKTIDNQSDKLTEKGILEAALDQIGEAMTAYEDYLDGEELNMYPEQELLVATDEIKNMLEYFADSFGIDKSFLNDLDISKKF